MQRFRNRSAPAAWLISCVIVLGGGLIATHSHDGLTSGKHSAVALSGGHSLPDPTEHIESPISIGDEHCPACAAGQRQAALDASPPTSRSRVMVARGVRTAHGLSISGRDNQPHPPRGPPTA